MAPELLRPLVPRSVGIRLQVPVVAVIPAHLLGLGAGLTSEGWSLHLQSSDGEEMAARGLNELRLGDVVGLEDYDSRYQHGYLRGAVGIAVIGQTDGPRAGYGPGMTLPMTDVRGSLEPVVEESVKLVEMLGLRA